jgi:hypothetical protein
MSMKQADEEISMFGWLSRLSIAFTNSLCDTSKL